MHKRSHHLISRLTAQKMDQPDVEDHPLHVVVLGQVAPEPQNTVRVIHLDKCRTMSLVVKQMAVGSQQCFISEARHEHDSIIQSRVRILMRSRFFPLSKLQS